MSTPTVATQSLRPTQLRRSRTGHGEVVSRSAESSPVGSESSAVSPVSLTNASGTQAVRSANARAMVRRDMQRLFARGRRSRPRWVGTARTPATRPPPRWHRPTLRSLVRGGSDAGVAGVRGGVGGRPDGGAGGRPDVRRGAGVGGGGAAAPAGARARARCGARRGRRDGDLHAHRGAHPRGSAGGRHRRGGGAVVGDVPGVRARQDLWGRRPGQRLGGDGDRADDGREGEHRDDRGPGCGHAR